MRSVALWLAASAAMLHSSIATAQVADPSGIGPLAVTSAEYRFASVAIPKVPYVVDVAAITWYPADLSGGPYPLVLFLHGNHEVCRDGAGDTCPDPPTCQPGATPIPSYRGFDYIAERLASWGYVVASIDGNATNCRYDAVPERGRLVQEHLRRWATWNAPAGAAPFGVTFAGKLDLHNVGLMGHSRGGEGMRAAYEYNRKDRAPFNVNALFEIAPVDDGVYGDRQFFNASNVNYSVLLPHCDADVADLAGMRVFDRALRNPETKPVPKAQQMVWGANHNFFNSEWDAPAVCTDHTPLTRAEQEQVGRTYVMGFMRTFLGREDFHDLFSGDVPPPPLPSHVDIAYTESPNIIAYVTDFADPEQASYTGNGTSRNPCSGSLPFSQGGCDRPWHHDDVQHALRLTWVSTLGTFSVDVAPFSQTRDVSTHEFLSFRITESTSNQNPPLPAPQNFTVKLVDGHGNTSAGVHAADYSYIHRPVGIGPAHTVLQTVRIPLADLTGVDLQVLRSMTINTDQEPKGEVFLSDIAFTPGTVVCGDGTTTTPENCDDGNATALDGCSSDCTAETCFVCTGKPSVCGRLSNCDTACGDAAGFDSAILAFSGLNAPAGSQGVTVKTTLRDPSLAAAAYDPSADGLELVITGSELVYALSGSSAIPPGLPGTGCGPTDGWRVNGSHTTFTYKNKTNALPPGCAPGSANGLRGAKVKDKLAAEGVLDVQIKVKRTSLASQPAEPLTATIVLPGSPSHCARTTLPRRKGSRFLPF